MSTDQQIQERAERHKSEIENISNLGVFSLGKIEAAYIKGATEEGKVA